MMTELEKEFLICGYHQLRPIKVTNKLLYARDILDSIPINDEYLQVNVIPEKEVIASAKNFFSAHLNLHPILMADTQSYLEVVSKTNAMMAKEWIALYKQIGIPISPFNLPIQYTEKHAFAGYLKTFGAYVDSDYVLKYSPALFLNIFLSKTINEDTPISYVHEIGHTQLMSVKGSVISFYDCEIIPIFLELVAAMDLDDDNYLLHINIVHRLETLIAIIESLNDPLFEEKLKAENDETENIPTYWSYVISIFKAFHLFSLYHDGNIETKKEIMAYIQKIFDGEIKVEDMLKKYSISYDNSMSKKSIMKVFTL